MWAYTSFKDVVHILVLWGGKGVTSAWSPLGNFLEGQATLGTIRPEDSGAVQNAKEFHH